MSDRNFDIIIVGGGMVGAALACSLGDSDFKVAVIESAELKLDWPPGSHDSRVSAITSATRNIFENLGAWQSMQDLGVTPYYEMQVWDNTGNGKIVFDSLAAGQPDLGHIIENRVIQKALIERLDAFDNISLFPGLSVKLLSNSPSEAVLVTELGERYTARLVVAADGANSKLREQCGIGLTSWAYDQSAVVCCVQTSLSHQNTCYQQFMPEGPLAFLPLQNNISAIVWSTSEERAGTLTQLSDADFNAQIQAVFGDRLGLIEAVTPRRAFPLRLRHAKRYVENRIVLVGDAAHTVHPLAGQGVNLGLLDIAVLAEELLNISDASADPGKYLLLRRYERRRKGDNVAMLAAMDGFKRLFSNDIPILRFARNTGLVLADQISPVKRLLTLQAMGLTGELPRLARPML